MSDRSHDIGNPFRGDQVWLSLRWLEGSFASFETTDTTFSITMIGPLIDFDDLRKLSRLGDAAKLCTVERWAQRVGIKYQYDGRGGIWTTVDAMNAAIGVVHDADPTLYDADKVA